MTVASANANTSPLWDLREHASTVLTEASRDLSCYVDSRIDRGANGTIRIDGLTAVDLTNARYGHILRGLARQADEAGVTITVEVGEPDMYPAARRVVTDFLSPIGFVADEIDERLVVRPPQKPGSEDNLIDCPICGGTGRISIEPARGETCFGCGGNGSYDTFNLRSVGA